MLRLVYDYRFVEKTIRMDLLWELGREPTDKEFAYAWLEYKQGARNPPAIVLNPDGYTKVGGVLKIVKNESEVSFIKGLFSNK